MAVPEAAATSLSDLALDGVAIAGMVLLAIVLMHVFKLLRAHALGADDDLKQQWGETEEQHFERLVEHERAAGFDESLNQGYDETEEEYGQRLEVREAIREQGVK